MSLPACPLGGSGLRTAGKCWQQSAWPSSVCLGGWWEGEAVGCGDSQQAASETRDCWSCPAWCLRVAFSCHLSQKEPLVPGGRCPSHIGDVSASVSSMSPLGCRLWVQSLGIWGEGESLEWVALEVGGEVGAVVGGSPPLGALRGL